MADLKWLDGYSGQTAQELIALSSEFRVDSLLVAFDEAIGKKEHQRGVAALSADERVVQAIEALQSEVNSGGYEQFFVNSSNQYAGIIVDSLRRIGCPQTAQITLKALNALDARDLAPATIEEAIHEPDDTRDRTLIECDDSFFAYAENIDEQLFAFIRSHVDGIDL